MSTDARTAPDFIPVQIHSAAGSVELIGERITPHFAITPSLGTHPHTGQLILTGGTVLTHIPTGRHVGSYWDDLRALAAELEKLPIDWATFEKGTREQAEMVGALMRRLSMASDSEGWPWPEWAGDEAQPALSLLGTTLDQAVKSHEHFRVVSSLGTQARQLLPEDLGRKIDAHLLAADSAATVNEYGVIYLLAVLHRLDPEAGDRAARELVSAWDSGDAIGEWTYQWRQELAKSRPLTLHGFPHVGLFDESPGDEQGSTAPNYPALTAEEFNEGCYGTFLGVPLLEDEDGSYVFAWGHRDPATFVEAIRLFDEETVGIPETTYDADDVQHRWAITLQPADGPEGWRIQWGGVTEDTPNAFAVTVVNR